MNSMKYDRHEGLFFAPPSSITFKIERHGGTVMGSHYGELQEWSIDMASNVANQAIVGKRRISPLDKSLDLQPLIDKVVAAINEGDTSNTVIKWLNENRIKVLAGDLIPETYKQTTANRRKRFRLALEEELTKSGWDKTSPNYFTKRAT